MDYLMATFKFMIT
jgi:hypothetical protein